MEFLKVEAVYEQGALKVPVGLPLSEGQKVTVTIHTGSVADRLYGMVGWTGSAEELDRYLDDPDEGQWGSRDL